jgi:hypothetical protein
MLSVSVKKELMLEDYKKSKLNQLIHFFAKEHKKASGYDLYKTTLLKYIGLFEFELFPVLGQPPIGLVYDALEKGIVAIDLYTEINEGTYQSELVKIEEDVDEDELGKEIRQIRIIPKEVEYNFDDFSDVEIDKMYELINKFGKAYINNNALIEETHKINSWIKAWNRRKVGAKKERMTFMDEIDKEQDPLLLEQYESSLLK